MSFDLERMPTGFQAGHTHEGIISHRVRLYVLRFVVTLLIIAGLVVFGEYTMRLNDNAEKVSQDKILKEHSAVIEDMALEK